MKKEFNKRQYPPLPPCQSPTHLCILRICDERILVRLSRGDNILAQTMEVGGGIGGGVGVQGGHQVAFHCAVPGSAKDISQDEASECGFLTEQFALPLFQAGVFSEGQATLHELGGEMVAVKLLLLEGTYLLTADWRMMAFLSR